MNAGTLLVIALALPLAMRVPACQGSCGIACICCSSWRHCRLLQQHVLRLTVRP